MRCESRAENKKGGVPFLISHEKPCAAVNAAMNAFNKEILAHHIEGCVARDIREGKDEVIDELVTILQKLMK